MASKELEFRGINLNNLCLYFEELGAKKVTNSFPYKFQSPEWRAEIISEEIITITSSFHVNAIKVRFIAETEENVESLIKSYRKKTTRVGG